MAYSTQCPNSTESGCLCVEHHPGLTAHHPGLRVITDAIAGRTTLRVVTMPPEPELHDPATCERMVCDDPACIAANARRTAQHVRQPWDVKAA